MSLIVEAQNAMASSFGVYWFWRDGWMPGQNLNGQISGPACLTVW